MKDTTLLVQTFMRPRALTRLLTSIDRFYPQCPVIVADDSEAPYPDVSAPFPNVRHLTMPFHQGLSAVRNFLVQEADTPWVVMLEDDFEFTEETRLDLLRETAAAHDWELVAGAVQKAGEPVGHFEGHWRVWHDTLYLLRTTTTRPLAVECAFNFFLARRAFLRGLPWDNVLKTVEHGDWFYRAALAGARMGYRPDVVMRHVDDRPDAYRPYRAEEAQKRKYHVMDKHGFERICEREMGGELKAWHQRHKHLTRPYITIICTTIGRFVHARRFVESYQEWFPDVPLIMVDQSRQHYTRRLSKLARGRYIETDYDIGASAALNIAWRAADTPFVVCCEDDFIFAGETDLEILAQLVDSTPYDILGGNVRRQRDDHLSQFFGRFWRDGRSLHVEMLPPGDPRSINHVDLTPNFWLADTAALERMDGWDDRFKVCRHLPFYLRAQEHGVTVGHYHGCTIQHHHAGPHDNEYPQLRAGRHADYAELFFELYGLDEVTGLNAMHRTPGGKIRNGP